MLFQNLYEDILVRQKLKTKQENHLINSIDIIKQKNVKIVILSHIQKEKKKILFLPPICIQITGSYLYLLSI